MTMSELAPRPPRRKRYRGTHPRRFDEKYKELDAQRFPAEQAKVRAQGRTPAGTHVPIMLREVLDILAPAPGEVALDCTLGYGGHGAELARRCGRLVGVDLDGHELACTDRRLKQAGLNVSTHHTNFAGLGAVLAKEGLTGVDVLLADLGVSSMQLDRPERGFAFKFDGPLDMRMDASRGKTAAEFLRDADETALAEILRDFGDEPQAAAVAAAIKADSPRTTGELVALVLRAKGLAAGRPRRRSAHDAHPAARVFQALRMAVNREAANLEHLLRILAHVLNFGGRAAIITFHSGEDRRVESALVRGREQGLFASIGGPLAPSREEIRANPRARSAKLRWAARSRA